MKCADCLLVSALLVVGVAACDDDEESTTDAMMAGFGDAAVGDAAVIDAPVIDAPATDVPVGDASGDVTGADTASALPMCQVDFDATISAKLRSTADDYVRIWFNGVLVAEPNTLWSVLKEYDVNVFLHAGWRNVIAIEARNEWELDGLDRGFIAELAYTSGGTPQFVDTDTTWKVSPAPAPAPVPELTWTALDFDDSGWAQAVSIGKSGIPPWGQVVFNTAAEWLWSYLPNGPAATKADKEVLRFRKVFFMNASALATDQPTCR